MDCITNYNSKDRICQLCSRTNVVDFKRCELLTAQKIQEQKDYNAEIRFIINTCPHREENCWEEYTQFTGCKKNGWQGKYTPSCQPTLDCGRYCGL